MFGIGTPIFLTAFCGELAKYVDVPECYLNKNSTGAFAVITRMGKKEKLNAVYASVGADNSSVGNNRRATLLVTQPPVISRVITDSERIMRRVNSADASTGEKCYFFRNRLEKPKLC